MRVHVHLHCTRWAAEDSILSHIYGCDSATQAFGDVIATISLLAPIYMGLEKPREHSNSCQQIEHETKVHMRM